MTKTEEIKRLREELKKNQAKPKVSGKGNKKSKSVKEPTLEEPMWEPMGKEETEE